MKSKKLSKEEIGNLGIYDFQAYVGAMNQSTFGGKEGTERLFDLLQLTESSESRKLNVLEIACSTGYNTFTIGQNFPNIQITGIDISEIGISKAN